MDPRARVVKVGILAGKIMEDSPLVGFLGFCDWAGWFLNPWDRDGNKMQSWLTHFSLIIELENKEVWKCERETDGVNLWKMDSPVTWEWHEWHGNERLSNISLSGIDFDPAFSGQDVLDFVEEQRHYEYNIIVKNCKHFVYDFFVYKLQHAWIKKMGFQTGFTQMVENSFAKGE